jgi:plastocyanin
MILSIAVLSSPAGAQIGEVTGQVLINSEPADRAVVYLQTMDGKTLPSTPDEKTIHQENLRFKPDFLVVPPGTTLRFENNDEEIHNVYSKSATARFDTGAILPHTAKKVALKEPGIVPLRCRTHQTMRGLIFVSSSPYFSVTDDHGRFEIQNVPTGSYRIEVWHPQLSPEERARGERVLEMGKDRKVVQLEFSAKAGRGVDLTEATGRDWISAVEQIRAELERAITLWKKGSGTAATTTVMSTNSKFYGESGLREAIVRILGADRALEHERRFDALRKRVQGIGGTEPTTEAALRRAAGLLIEGLTADARKLAAP